MKIIFVVLMIGIIFSSISVIEATDSDLNITNDIFTNHDDLIAIDDFNSSNSENLGDVNISDSNSSNNGSFEDVNVSDSNSSNNGSFEDVNVSDSNSSNNGSFEDVNEENTAKIITSITTSNIEMYFKNGTKFQATLLDYENRPVVNQTIKFLINGDFYSRKTNENGTAGMNINLGPGKYDILVLFNGSESHEKCESYGSVVVLSTINSEDVVKYYRNDTQYFAYFLDGHGNPLANASVSFNIGGEFYNRITKENGSARLNINLAPGDYVITAIHADGLLQSNKIKVLSTIVGEDVVKYYGNDTQYFAYFLDGHGNPLINETVYFNINGVFYNRITKENGSARLNINLAPGDYVITAIHSNGLQYSNNIRVLSTIVGEDVVKYYRNDTQYFAYFLDGQGNPLANASVSFNINGVFYNRTTKENGSARLNINLAPGDYVITAIHSDGLLQSNNIRVLSTINGINLVKAYMDKNQYRAYFVNGNGDPLVNARVNFNINGMIYNRTTDNNGSAKLNINLVPGKYVLTAYNSVDGLYMSNIITVLQDVKTIIKVDNATFMENDTKNITVELWDELNYTLENKTVSLIVNGATYSSITDENGKAIFKFDLPAGLFNAHYKFAGNNVYQSSDELRYIRVLNGIDVHTEVLDKYSYKKDSFNVRICDLNDIPLENITVTFVINNKKQNSVTNGEGIATANINLKVGTHKIAYYVNQPKYDNLTRNATLIVISSDTASFSTDVTSFYEGIGGKFSVNLFDGTIKLPNEVVSFVVNGKTYNGITDSNGLVILNVDLPAGEYNINTIFAGNSKIKNLSSVFKLTVIKRLPTHLEYIGEYAFKVDDPGNKFDVKLTDSDNNVLSDKVVIFNIDGVESKKTTDKEGIASLDINLGVGFYNVYYRFDALDQYLESSGVQEIRVLNFGKSGNGYWLWGAHMYQANLASLAQQGTTDIFLLSAAISTHGEKNVVQWIAKAKSYGIRVHIWMLTFYDGSFISPVLSDGTPNYSLFNTKISQAKYYASLPGVSGIHLDYVRFPGTAYKYSGSVAAINQFVKSCGEAIRAINPNIIYSAAVMPEPSSNVYYYGQDVSTLGKYLDVIIPMVYKGNYHAGTSWIGSTTKWFVQHSSGAQIWTGLQAYYSDDRVVPLPVSELSADAKIAIDNGAGGVVMFRWGVTNFINFNDL